MSGTWPLARAAIAAQLNGTVLGPLIDLAYDNEAGGPFTLGELLTFQGGATGRLQALVDSGTTGTMQVRLIGAVAVPADNETITGSTSAATAAVNGTITTGIASQTLNAYQYAPRGRQGANRFPYAFPIRDSTSVGRGPGMFREQVIEPRIRVMLAGDGTTDMETLQKQYDGWVEALMDAWDDAATLDGAADISVEQEFDGLAAFDDLDTGWGFEMHLNNLRISEEKTFSA